MDRNFDRIVNSYADMLLRICMHYTNNISDAEDVVQAAFLKLVEKNVVFESLDHEKAWLIRVCINLCKDSLKSSWKKKVHSVHDREFKDQPYEIADESPLLSYIRTLPPKQKTAIYLFYYEDMQVKEIAEILDISENNVKTRLSRGRSLLKEALNGGI